MKHIYIVLSQTGTITSKIIKRVTNDKYNHASISLTPTLETLYSFGRLNPYNPIWGGFVRESISGGTFKRFKNTEALIIELSVSDQKYMDMKEFIEDMYKQRQGYHYNYLGLAAAAFKLDYNSKKGFYCSQFVKEVLVRFDIENSCSLPQIIKPVHFLRLDNINIRYRGNLQAYRHIRKHLMLGTSKAAV